ncbi:MAG: ABC transporter ATP-binding protein, partial [Aeromicrobium sp.]
MMSSLAVSDLTKTYGDVTAVGGVDLSLTQGTLTALLGPSGCGKSTTLQMIAGLVTPDSGLVQVDGVDVTGMPTERRPVALVFQKPLLFPHLNVTQNVAFGLKMQGISRPDTAKRVTAMLEQVQLDGFGDRRPHELSGGQEQRVALARALVLSPSLLLLDEPFSQLDAALRAEMRALVRDLHESTGVTTLFVTHDQAEAVEIANRIVLMLDGAVEASGAPEDLYANPPTLETARFLGVSNELRGIADGSVVEVSGHLIDVGENTMRGPVVVAVRPEALSLTAPAEAGAFGVMVGSVRF